MATKKEKTPEQLRDEFRAEMSRISQVLDIQGADIGRDQFLRESKWDRKKLDGIGQFNTLKKMYFPRIEVPAMKTGAAMVQAHRNKFEKQVGMTKFVADEMTKVLKEHLEKHPIKFHKPVKRKKKAKSKDKRTLFAHWSDSHFGSNIKKSEVQVNEYNWVIASRRLALFVEQICTYKPQYRSETELVLGINGDILAGVIHDQEWFADLLIDQYVGAVEILGQAITYLAQHFDIVRVKCSPGNHGRAMHKSGKSRATTHKYDSYETMLYVALKHSLSQHPNIEIEIPKTPYVVIEAQGHKFFMTHGDTVINVGNPGKSLDMKNINDQINKMNASTVGGEGGFAGLIVGHVHTPTIQLSEVGCMVIINGCSSGLDPFAQSIGIFSSNPTQQIFEVTKEHAVGDIRFIQLKPADDRKDLDEIIKPYSKETREF